MATHVSVGDICRLTGKRDWTIRRAVDRMEPPVEKLARVRAIPVERVSEVLRLSEPRKPGRKRKDPATEAAANGE